MSGSPFDPATIDRLIRPLIGPFDEADDCYQDIQVKILERLPQSDEEITAIATAVRKQHTTDYLRRKYTLQSLQAPIGGQGDNALTWESVLAEQPIEEPEDCSPAIEPSTRALVRFLIKELAEGKSLNWSILSLLRRSSELLTRYYRPWEAWEEDLLREKYPRGGRLAVALFVNRTVNAIASRTWLLGIRRDPNRCRIAQDHHAIRESGWVERGQGKTQRSQGNEHRHRESRRVRDERLRVNKQRYQENNGSDRGRPGSKSQSND